LNSFINSVDPNFVYDSDDDDRVTGVAVNFVYDSDSDDDDIPDLVEVQFDSINHQIRQGGILPAIEKEAFNVECYITQEDIISSYFQCTNPHIQHCYDANAYIRYVNTLTQTKLECPLCKVHEMNPQLYCLPTK